MNSLSSREGSQAIFVQSLHIATRDRFQTYQKRVVDSDRAMYVQAQFIEKNLLDHAEHGVALT